MELKKYVIIQYISDNGYFRMYNVAEVIKVTNKMLLVRRFGPDWVTRKECWSQSNDRVLKTNVEATDDDFDVLLARLKAAMSFRKAENVKVEEMRKAISRMQVNIDNKVRAIFNGDLQ